MSLKSALLQFTISSALSTLLLGCYKPPYNNFEPYNSLPKSTTKGAVVGLVAGTVASGVTTAAIPVGVVAGGMAGAAVSIYNDSKPGIIRELNRNDIEFIEYGDTKTLIVPVDRYFIFNTPRLNDLCYPGLTAIVKLIKLYPCSIIYVAGFTDNVGSRYRKYMMSQAQSETMLTYLWANGIPAKRLTAQGYGDKNTVSDNRIIHGSAQNRRIEIQWFNCPKEQSAPLAAMTK